jgi:16S rRNA (guanine527-N7)-methyltransferase
VTPQEALSNGAAVILKRPLSAHERDDFSKYLSLLLKWQKAHRLVGSSDPMWIVEHLFLDSLLFLKLLPALCRKLADVGSGAGLPGLPIKIVRNDLEVVLIESRRRRAMFLNNALRDLKLDGIQVLEGRIENLPSELNGSFDAAVMRCAGDIEDMIPAAAVLVADSGVVIASGPPKPRPLSVGEWVTVPGVRSGTSRRFARFTKRSGA